MAHAAIVSREYGLPAVVGTGFGTKMIKTGQLLRVDGDNGVVDDPRVTGMPSKDASFSGSTSATVSSSRTVGGKCASLGELIKAGVAVPTGFAVTTSAHRDVPRAEGAGRASRGARRPDRFRRRSHRRGGERGDPRSSSKLPRCRRKSREAIAGAYQDARSPGGLGPLPVAVRSSASRRNCDSELRGPAADATSGSRA